MPRLGRALTWAVPRLTAPRLALKGQRGRRRNEGLAMKAAGISLALVAAALTGCSGASSLPSLPSLTTGSILGGPAKPTAADPGSINDPTNRAFQVGTVSAKAIKCGF